MNPKLQRVARAIEQRFRDHLDLSNAGPAKTAVVFRTRGLAALAIQLLTTEEPMVAASCVIDGFDDNGIDAIYVDESTPRLILVQSKWHESSQRSINLGEAQRFIGGMRVLTDERFERFNGTIDALAPRISAVLRRPDLRIDLVVVTTGEQDFSSHVRQAFDDECRTVNEPGEILRVRLLRLDDLHQYVLDTAVGEPTDLTATIENWGYLKEPYEACYGTMTATQLVEWHRRFGDRLFDQNLRKALGATHVNQSLIATLERETQHFWYFNNGVTVLCQRFQRAPLGGPQRQRGEFTLYGVSVVNGAQTVTSLTAAAQHRPDCLTNARVSVRVISLENCPETFAADVTRATNTQNHVVPRDFVALDPLQARLRRDLLLTLHKTYVIKRGDERPAADDGCAVDEATMALACAHPDTRYAVLAHSNPSALWDMSENGHYYALFRRELTALELWRWICAARRVEQVLSATTANYTGRARAVAGQADRLVAHIVLNRLTSTVIDAPAFNWEEQLDRIRDLTPAVVDLVVTHANKEFDDTPVPTLFKNLGKSRQLVALVVADLGTEGTTGPHTAASRGTSAPVDAQTRLQFHLSRRGVSARGHLQGKAFVVRAGSLAAAETAPSLQTNPSALTRREWLIAQGAFVAAGDQPGLLVLAHDEYFDSPSQAAAVMLGRPSNGRTDWRTADGLSLNQALRERRMRT